MPKLPDLDRRQTRAFLAAFAIHWEHRDGSLITGKGRSGQPFSFHAEHPAEIRRDFLPRLLRLLKVSREEFEAWYAKNR